MPLTMLRSPGGDLLDPGQHQCGNDENAVDDHLPHDLLVGVLLDIDERFQQMHGGDADEGGGEFDLQHPSVHVGKPFRLVRVAFQIQARDESLVTADDHHDEQVRYHDHVDETQHGEHDFVLVHGGGGEDELPQLMHETENVNTLGDDEAKIERGLQPAAEENQAAEGVLKG